jgi:hypothetical protein
MNIIQHLQQDKNYVKQASKALHINFETIDIDCSHGETDKSLILFIKKDNYTFDEAFAILTMKQKMLAEEWEDLELYDAEDVKFWGQMLVKEYGTSTYHANVTKDDFMNNHFNHLLKFEDGVNSIFYNDIQISFAEFIKNNPFNVDFVNVAKSIYTRLEVEYYIETEAYFVLFNWYTTA